MNNHNATGRYGEWKTENGKQYKKVGEKWIEYRIYENQTLYSEWYTKVAPVNLNN